MDDRYSGVGLIKSSGTLDLCPTVYESFEGRVPTVCSVTRLVSPFFLKRY